MTRRLESDLLSAGEALVRVPTRLMAAERRGGRERGKSDPIDALAVARAALREDNLPLAHLYGPARELRLLVDHRDDLVAERTRIESRLRWHLHELFPEWVIAPRVLGRFKVLDEVQGRLVGAQGTVAVIARELTARIRELTVRVNELQRQSSVIVAELAPSLLSLAGCGALSAAKLVGEVAGVRRFYSKASFARWNGTAPIPVWSSDDPHFRLNRGGNRQVNAALHRIALTQWRCAKTPGHDYVTKRMARGDNKKEALRLLRRRLSDEVFRRLLIDESSAVSAADEDFQRAA